MGKCNKINETKLLKKILKLKNQKLEILLDKMSPIYDMISDLDKLQSKHNKKLYFNIKILDSSLIIFVEMQEIIKENSLFINKQLRSLTNSTYNYTKILNIIFINLIKHILAYRKIYLFGLIPSANILLRVIIELTELITAMLYKPEIIQKYAEYSKKLLEEGDTKDTSRIWNNYIKPSKIREILKEFESKVLNNEVDIYSKRKNNYNFVSKAVHNEFVASSSYEPEESIKILLLYFNLFFLQINYLFQKQYSIELDNEEKTGDYKLHLDVFYLLFSKFYF